MDCIPEDCLYSILSLVSLNEKFHLRSVNKTWKCQLERLLKFQKILKFDRDVFTSDQRTLVLQGLGLADVLPIFLKSCPSIEVIHAPREMLFVDQLLPIASSLAKISCRQLSWLDFTSSGGARHALLMHFTNLRSIEIEQFDFPLDLAQLCNSSHDTLKHIHFNSRSWRVRDFYHIMNTLPSNLESLSCVNWEPPLNLESMPFAGNLKSLKIVFLEEPFDFPSLEAIECTVTVSATPGFFDSISKSTRLKKFNVQIRAREDFISDFSNFLSKVNFLKEVSINCFRSDGLDEAVDALVTFCPEIRILFIRWKGSLASDTTLHRITSLENLVEFSLHTPEAQVTFEAIEHLLIALPELKRLDLRWNKNNKISPESTIPDSLHQTLTESVDERGTLNVFNLPVKCHLDASCTISELNTHRNF